MVSIMVMASVKILVFVAVICLCIERTLGIRHYYMDKLSDCSRTINVDDTGVKVHGRSLSAPSNPPLRCVIYLQSSYTRNDGSNKLQIDVDNLNINDCTIKVDLYNGRTSVGQYLKALSCQRKPTGVIYSNSNEVTIKLTRPDTLFNTEYGFTLTIKPWNDRTNIPSESNEALSVGAIIGIVIGCLVLIAVLILLFWCCCSGRISGFIDDGSEQPKKSVPGHVNSGLAEEKYKPPTIYLNGPSVWSTNNWGAADGHYQPRFNRSGPYNNSRGGRMGQGRFRSNDHYYNERSVDQDPRQQEGTGYNNNVRHDRFRNRARGPTNDYELYEMEQTNKKTSPQQPRKETLIDDVYSNTECSEIDDATLQKRPLGPSETGSPKSKRKSGPIPEEDGDLDAFPQLERYKSMDLQSQPDTDTITSPVHVNAGVLASVEDDDPVGSLRKNRKVNGSPKSRHKDGRQRQPDSMAMPPEAFEPIFTEPISGINYPANHFQPGYGQMVPQFPGGFMPYGMIPSGAFAPGVPGSQTFAYAYQTVPTGAGGMPGEPASQGAWVVQNTPTSEGNRRTAFAVEETVSPDKSSSQHGRRKKSLDPFGRSPYRDSNGSKRGKHRDRGYNPDMSIVTRGAAPPEPGQGHRSVALKSGTDPDTGIHTVQGVWTDTVADPTDPSPGVDNPQITRKTITRVTTKSGYGELPPENDPLIALEAEPAFLAPSARPTEAYTPSIMPPSSSNQNIDFYTGAGSLVPPPERSSTPNSLKAGPVPKYSSAIRDRIPLNDSTV